MHSERCWQSCLYWEELGILTSWCRAGELSRVQGRRAALYLAWVAFPSWML